MYFALEKNECKSSESRESTNESTIYSVMLILFAFHAMPQKGLEIFSDIEFNAPRGIEINFLFINIKCTQRYFRIN